MTIKDYIDQLHRLDQEGIDRFALNFYRYMNEKAWELDFKEQKTHTPEEHLEHFKEYYDYQRIL